MIRKTGLTLALCAAAALLLAACGSSSDDTSSTASTPAATDTSSSGGGGAGGTIDVSADPSGALKFEQTELSTSAGSNTINFTNDSSVPHNVTIEPEGSEEDVGATDTITGDSTSATVDLEPGTYKFYCSVDSHEDAGMEGTLTVK